MVEAVVFGIFFFPQLVAGFLAKSMGRNFWFWFFISFLIPIISLIILLSLKNKNENVESGYQLADHVRQKNAQPEDTRDYTRTD